MVVMKVLKLPGCTKKPDGPPQNSHAKDGATRAPSIWNRILAINGGTRHDIAFLNAGRFAGRAPAV